MAIHPTINEAYQQFPVNSTEESDRLQQATSEITTLERLVAHQSAEIESLRADNRKALSELQFAVDGSWEASRTTQAQYNNLIAERDTLTGQIERLSRAFLKYVTTF